MIFLLLLVKNPYTQIIKKVFDNYTILFLNLKQGLYISDQSHSMALKFKKDKKSVIYIYQFIISNIIMFAASVKSFLF